MLTLSVARYIVAWFQVVHFVGKEKGMANRFNNDQKLLSDSIKDLIQIYYEGNAHLDKAPWHTDKIRKGLARLLGRLYGDCQQVKTDQYLEFTYGKSDKAPDGISCYIGQDEWADFVLLMDRLAEAIKNFENYPLGGTHFVLLRIEDELETALDAGLPAELEVLGYTPPRSITRKLVRKAMKAGAKVTHELNRSNTLACVPRRFVRVTSVSEFGAWFLNSGERGEQFDRFPFLTSLHGLNFIELVRTLIINFCIEFDDLERLKACALDRCGRIFFEKKKGAARFCCLKCRRQYNYELETPEKRQCRDRQNHWLRYQIDNRLNLPDRLVPNHVSKSDCGLCNTCVPTGQCIALRTKNPALF